jgi:hypothetical protein
MDWIHLAEDSDQWSALVSTIMNIRFPKTLRNFSVAEQLVTIEEGLRFWSEFVSSPNSINRFVVVMDKRCIHCKIGTEFCLREVRTSEVSVLCLLTVLPSGWIKIWHPFKERGKMLDSFYFRLYFERGEQGKMLTTEWQHWCFLVH